jgi:hypothetical protein
LVVAKIRERLAVSKQPVNKMDVERFSLKKIKEGEVKNSIRLQSKTDFHLRRTLRIMGTLVSYLREYQNICQRVYQSL